MGSREVEANEKIVRIIAHLTDQLIGGYAALQVYKRLGTAFRETGFKGCGFFFTPAYVSCRDVAILTLARLALPEKDSITIHYLLNAALESRKAFPHAGPETVIEAYHTHQIYLSELEDTLTRIKQLRDKRLAHLDRKFINDPSSMLPDPQIHADEMERVFITLLEIFNVYNRFAKDTELYIGNLETEVERSINRIFSRLR